MEATWKGPAGGGYVVEPWEGGTVEARTLSGSPNHLEEARTVSDPLNHLEKARTRTMFALVEARTLSDPPNHLEEARTRTLSALVEARTLTGLYERAFSQNWPKPS